MQECNNPDLSIIIVNYNTKELLNNCLSSITENKPYIHYEIIVVDNASQDGSAEYVRSNHPDILLIENEQNVGFSKGNNIGIKKASGPLVLLLNSDTIILPGALDELYNHLQQNPKVDAVGPMLLNHDRSVQRSYFDFPSIFKTFSHILGTTRIVYRLTKYPYIGRMLAKLGYSPAFLRSNFKHATEVDYLLFACILIRANVFERIGLLDEQLFFYHEDFEFGYRMHLNKMRINYLPSCKIIHFGGGTSGKYILHTYRANFVSLIYVYSKHYGYLRALLLRIAIIIGFLWRSSMWFVGGYRKVNKVGAYNVEKEPQIAVQEPTKVLLTYLGIIKDTFLLQQIR